MNEWHLMSKKRFNLLQFLHLGKGGNFWKNNIYLHAYFQFFQLILGVLYINLLVKRTNKACTYTSLEKGIKVGRAYKPGLTNRAHPSLSCGTLIDKKATAQWLLGKLKFSPQCCGLNNLPDGPKTCILGSLAKINCWHKKKSKTPNLYGWVWEMQCCSKNSLKWLVLGRTVTEMDWQGPNLLKMNGFFQNLIYKDKSCNWPVCLPGINIKLLDFFSSSF